MKLHVCSVKQRNSVNESLSRIPSQALMTASSFGFSSSMRSPSSDLKQTVPDYIANAVNTKI